MLHLHKVSRNIASLLISSRTGYLSTRFISSSSAAYVSVGNVSVNSRKFLQRFSAELHSKVLYQKHFYSTKGKSDEEAGEEIEVEKLSDFVHTHLPATVAIPEVWPYLPCVATSRNPLFPRFMKILEVSRDLS